jgi:hypothetical protein
MKILAIPIHIICSFDAEGNVKPRRCKVEGENGAKVFNIDRILKRETEKLAGNPMLLFTCESVIEGQMWNYQLKYEIFTNKWMLFRIWR